MQFVDQIKFRCLSHRNLQCTCILGRNGHHSRSYAYQQKAKCLRDSQGLAFVSPVRCLAGTVPPDSVIASPHARFCHPLYSLTIPHHRAIRSVLQIMHACNDFSASTMHPKAEARNTSFPISLRMHIAPNECSKADSRRRTVHHSRLEGPSPQ